MLAEFLTWWGQNLLALVPQEWRDRAAGHADSLIADATTPGLLTLRRRRAGVESKLATFSIDDEHLTTALRAALPNLAPGEPIHLRVPPSLVLEREVSLPLAAERDMERVVAYDMERLTPFTTAEVFWGVSLLTRDKARGKIQLSLTIVPRTALADLLDRLIAAGLTPQNLEIPGEIPRSIRLNHDTRGSNGRRTQLAYAAIAALLVLVLISPFLRQTSDLASLERRENSMQSQLTEAQKLRDTIMGSGTGGDAVLADTKRVGDALSALAAITEILPNTAYLNEFTMRERKINLSGLATSAAPLIAALSNDPRIRNPAFSAPVTRNDMVKLDVFSIRAEVAP